MVPSIIPSKYELGQSYFPSNEGSYYASTSNYLSNTGHVVGQLFYYDGALKSLASLVPANSGRAMGLAINDNDEIVGQLVTNVAMAFYTNTSGGFIDVHALLKKNDPAISSSSLVDITEYGLAVGYYVKAAFGVRQFTAFTFDVPTRTILTLGNYAPKKMTNLGVICGYEEVYFINPRGMRVSSHYPISQRIGEAPKRLESKIGNTFSSQTFSYANNLNPFGIIVGEIREYDRTLNYGSGTWTTRAAIWNGSFKEIRVPQKYMPTDLNAATQNGYLQLVPSAINPLNLIVGSMKNENSSSAHPGPTTHAYIGTVDGDVYVLGKDIPVAGLTNTISFYGAVDSNAQGKILVNLYDSSVGKTGFAILNPV